jgi:hypothetical protein
LSEIFPVMFILFMHHFFVTVELAGENGILTYHIDDALEQINQSEDGEHHLIIYPELRVLTELYTKYIKHN